MSPRKRWGMPVRRSHLVGMLGPGSLVSFQNGTTGLVAELPEWFMNKNTATSHADSLVNNLPFADELGVPELRTPPSDDGEHRRYIQAYRFPLWERCPRCGQVGVADRSVDGTAMLACVREKCQGVRRHQMDLVAVCKDGHVDDVPWDKVAHPESAPCPESALGKSLVVKEVVSADGIYKASCSSCGSSGEVMRDTLFDDCRGRFLWARDPEETRVECNNQVRVVDRHATAFYYPRIISRLFLPSSAQGPSYSEKSEYDDLSAVKESTDLIVKEGGYFSGRSVVFHVTCVERLRETRALAGFDRLVPTANKTPLQHMKDTLWAGKDPKWALVVDGYGEGLFVRVESSALVAVTPDERDASLHTLSHLLLMEVSIRCGYPSASLREKLFTSPNAMGILIYTTSGDESGTLGGLARLGKSNHLQDIMVNVEKRARWCSADPLCGHGAQNGGRAACHRCVLISETSCERQNRDLDRLRAQKMFD